MRPEETEGVPGRYHLPGTSGIWNSSTCYGSSIYNKERSSQWYNREIVYPCLVTEGININYHKLATWDDVMTVKQEWLASGPQQPHSGLLSQGLWWSGRTPTPWFPRKGEFSAQWPFTNWQFPLDLDLQRRKGVRGRARPTVIPSPQHQEKATVSCSLLSVPRGHTNACSLGLSGGLRTHAHTSLCSFPHYSQQPRHGNHLNVHQQANE